MEEEKEFHILGKRLVSGVLWGEKVGGETKRKPFSIVMLRFCLEKHKVIQ